MTPPATPPDPLATPAPSLPLPPASAASAPPQSAEASPLPALPALAPADQAASSTAEPVPPLAPVALTSVTPPDSAQPPLSLDPAAPAPSADAIPPSSSPATPAPDATLPLPEPPPLLPPPPPPAHPLVFHGRTEEYFRIWIVNTLLTIVTCGVFFSWAKVRKRRYVRGCTELLGHRFDYQARPLRLLIGHLVVLTLVLGYSLFGVVYPWVRYSVIALAVVLLPWIVVRSMSFNAHHTVYRGLRFRFHRSLSAAFMVYILEPLLLPFTLGLYYPAWQRSKRRYAIDNHRYGDTSFRYTGTAGPFYGAYFAAGGIVAVGAIAGGAALAFFFTQNPGATSSLLRMAPFFALYIFGFFLAKHLLFAMVFNHVWNHTQLAAHRFRARLGVGRWLGMQLGNLGAILLTAGMLYPWAEIRNQRYLASSLDFLPAGPVDAIRASEGGAGSATGDMAAEFIGIDFGL